MGFTLLPQHPNAAPPEPSIYRMTQHAFPDWIFEWHTKTKNVYVIRRDAATAQAFAHNIETHGMAQQCVMIWLRGYRQALVDQQPVPWEPPRQSPIPPVEPEAKA